MKRIRTGIIGAGAVTEWSLLPLLSGPDAVAAPDTGAWWGRRPMAETEIQYQAPARPEVVALADVDGERAARVASSWRIRAHYDDWRRMLQEVELDALFCLAPPEAVPEIVMSAATRVRHLWLDGPPAPLAAAARHLAGRMAGTATQVWCAHPLRRAAAHRAAWRLVERGGIGPVSALALRWGLPLHSAASAANGRGPQAPYLASTYAAFDMLLAWLARGRGIAGLSGHFLAAECEGASSLLLHIERGPSASALFAGADSWSSSLPRLEICGTEGRSVVCEAGRRLWVHEPRESARYLEPPGLASYVSAANIVGLAEDVKEFLAAAAGQPNPYSSGDQGSAVAEAAHVLAGVEAAAKAVQSGELVAWTAAPVVEAAASRASRKPKEGVSETSRQAWSERDSLEVLFPGEARETSLTLPL